jgi:hypothetical protein
VYGQAVSVFRKRYAVKDVLLFEDDSSLNLIEVIRCRMDSEADQDSI